MTVTYISGGTDWRTGMIGLLKNLCLYRNSMLACGGDGLVLPVGTLDIGLNRVGQCSVLEDVGHF